MEQDAWQVFGYCLRLSWAPGLHDTDGLGIVLSVLYAAATVLVAAVAIRGAFPGPDGPRQRWLWGLSAGALLLLTVNKQMDLQSLITDTGRCMARLQGWYDERRTIQREAVIALIALGAVVLVALPLVFRRALRGSLLLVAGLVALTVFVMIRAISFHDADHWLGTELASVKLHRLIEMLAIGLVLAAAIRRLRRG